MKNFYLLCATLFFCWNSMAQPTFEWAKSFSGTNHQFGNDITTDASGNVYTTGNCYGTTDFDPGPGTFNLTSNGYEDVFVSKLDASGNFQWAKSFGAAGIYDEGFAIAVDPTGNVFVSGTFTTTVDFDPGPGVFNITALGGRDIFILKLDASGNFIWAKSIGGGSDEGVKSMVLDAAGNICLTGYFSGLADFDPGAGVANLSAVAGSFDIFVAKLDASGNYVFAKRMGANDTDSSEEMVLDASGNIYVTGTFRSTVDFDPGAGVTNLTSAGAYDIFVTKFDASGNFVWAKGIGSTADDQGWDIALDASGNVLTTGFYSNNADFDPGAGSFIMPATLYDVFVLKLDANGNFIWVKTMGGANLEIGANIRTDAANNIYTSGYFYGSGDFDPGITTATLTSLGDADIFFSKLDASGNHLWANQIGGVGGEVPWSMTRDASGNIYTTGQFQNTVDFDFSAGVFNIAALGLSEAFILKTSDCVSLTQPSAISGNTTICSGSTNTYSVTNDVSATSYTWTLPSGWTGTSATNSISVTAGATGGTISVIATNACGSSTAQTVSVTVNTSPSTPGSISGNTTICSGTSQTYSITSVAGATSYTWNLPAGWSGTSTTNSINVTSGSVGGNITVTADNSCGNSATQSLTVTVNTVPAQPSSVAGSNSVCEGSLQNYSVTNDVTATSYTWTLPATWSGTSTTNNIAATAGTTSGMISVTANNSCGSSTAQTLNITVNSLPTVALSLNATSVCVDNAVFALSGGLPAGGTFTGTGVTGNNFNAAAAGVGTYTITYTFTDANSCTNTNTDQITVNNCTSITNSESPGSNFNVYPNPFTNAITITGNFTGTTTATLINAVGETVLTVEIAANHSLITSSLPSGVYFLHIKLPTSIIAKKIIKN